MIQYLSCLKDWSISLCFMAVIHTCETVENVIVFTSCRLEDTTFISAFNRFHEKFAQESKGHSKSIGYDRSTHYYYCSNPIKSFGCQVTQVTYVPKESAHRYIWRILGGECDFTSVLMYESCRRRLRWTHGACLLYSCFGLTGCTLWSEFFLSCSHCTIW